MSTLVNGLQYGTICHRGAGEIIACGWASDQVLFRSATSAALTADVLHSAATQLVVCAAVVGEGDPIPRSAIIGHDDGSVLVAVDDGAGAIKVYRCRSFADGFSEV